MYVYYYKIKGRGLVEWFRHPIISMRLPEELNSFYTPTPSDCYWMVPGTVDPTEG